MKLQAAVRAVLPDADLSRPSEAAAEVSAVLVRPCDPEIPATTRATR